jgi:hypothetical protein
MYYGSKFYKKSLKTPKGQPESVYRRRTDNTMARRKSTKGQTTIYKTTHKTKDQVTRTSLKTRGELINLVTNPVISYE